MYSVATFVTWLILCGQSAALKNVLMLMMDDFRPEAQAWSDVSPSFNPKIKTPNLDALAGRSLVLKQNYCQQPSCNPSRTSLLTSRRPEDTHILATDNYFRETAGNFTTLPQYFKNMGYTSVGIGKVFHYGRGSGYGEPPSWSVPPYHVENPWKGKTFSWYSVSRKEQKRRPLQDDNVKETALKVLHKLSKQTKKGVVDPFFLAVGFHKPHLPFIAPKKFFNLYPLHEIEPPQYKYVPSNFPEIAWGNSFEVRGYKDVARLNLTGEYNTTLPDDWTLDLRRAYYASISYVDSLIGEIVSELEKLGLAENTIIAFLGDHGYLLGEHGMWAKNSIFELTDNAPMMIRVPKVTDGGIVTWRLTEHIDLYPTLVELAGLPQIPLCPKKHPNHIALCRQGTSFVPLIYEPKRPWKPYVFSMFPRTQMKEMGYSIKSDDGLRYMNWVKFNKKRYRPHWAKQKGEEFYNHTVDPHENINLYQSTDKSILSEKRRLRRALTTHGWRGANPELLYKL